MRSSGPLAVRGGERVGRKGFRSGNFVRKNSDYCRSRQNRGRLNYTPAPGLSRDKLQVLPSAGGGSQDLGPRFCLALTLQLISKLCCGKFRERLVPDDWLRQHCRHAGSFPKNHSTDYFKVVSATLGEINLKGAGKVLGKSLWAGVFPASRWAEVPRACQIWRLTKGGKRVSEKAFSHRAGAQSTPA